MDEALYLIAARAAKLASIAASAVIREQRISDSAIEQCAECFEAIAQALDALDTPEGIESGASYRMMAVQARKNLRGSPSSYPEPDR